MNVVLYITVILSVELIAALSGSYYLKTVKTVQQWDRLFVYYLWAVFAVELIAIYTAIGYYSDYQYFAFIKDTPFADNTWIYNVFMIVDFSFLTLYFRSYIEERNYRNILLWLTFLYVFVCVCYLIYSKIFFDDFSRVSMFLGTVLLIGTIFLFYFRILKSDKILRLKGYLPFYLSVGCGIFNLCTTPVFLYSNYVTSDNDIFVNFYRNILFFGIIFLSLIYSVSFILCSKEKK